MKQISGRCNALFIRPARKLYLHIPCIFHRGGFNKISVCISSFLVSSFTAVSRHHQRHYSLEEFQAKTARTWLGNEVVLNIAVLRYFTLIHIALLINYRHKVFYFFFFKYFIFFANIFTFITRNYNFLTLFNINVIIDVTSNFIEKEF